MSSILPDGSYDVLVVDIEVAVAPADSSDEPLASGSDADMVAIEVVITAGEHKGHVVTVEFFASIEETAAIEALGIPGTLTVTNGQPSLQLEPEADR